MSPQNRNALHCGTSGCGKTTAALDEVIALAERDYAEVVVDPHEDALASLSLEHLVSRGHEPRIIFDSLSQLDRVPAYEIIRP